MSLFEVHVPRSKSLWKLIQCLQEEISELRQTSQNTIEELGMLAHTYTPSTQKAEAGGL